MTINQDRKITNEEIGKGYDAIAEKVYVSEDFYNEVLDIVPTFLGDILEIGVGQGVVLKNILERGGTRIASLTGIDLSDRLIAMARDTVPQAKIIKADAAALPFQDNSFDMVVMVDTFQYLLDFDRALEEVRRVLKRKGTMLVTAPNKKWILFKSYIQKRKNIQPVEDHFFTYGEMKTLLLGHGFKIEKMCGADAFRFYGKRHKFEKFIAFFLPFLNCYMKKMVFYCSIRT
jgi:ubiquinone/menaquinone biosynthesis C-methylase UbiE